MDDLITEIRQESATRREAKYEQKGRDRALSYGPLLISFALPYAREACVDDFGERRKNEVRKGNAYCMSLTCQQLCLGFSCFQFVPDNNPELPMDEETVNQKKKTHENFAHIQTAR